MPTKLFDDFDALSKKHWKQLLQVDLKGDDYHDLITSTLEGIDINPFYTAEDFKGFFQEPVPNQDYKIAQRFFFSESSGLKHQMKVALDAGTSYIFLEASRNLEALIDFLKSIDFEDQMVIEVSKLNPKQIQTLCFNYKGALNYDPIGNLERTGYFPKGFDWGEFKSLMRLYSDQISIDLNAFIYAEAGANITQQISFSLSKAKDYMEKLNYQSDLVFSNHMSIGANFFFEITKVRLFRKIWRDFNNSLGTNYEIGLSGKSSQRFFTTYDYNNNIIRSATANLAAAIGGIETLEQVPYDVHFKKKNEFSESVARSQLLVLKHETDILKKDWVLGNYFMDQLADKLAIQIIKLCQEIEAKGGLLKGLFDHEIQEMVFLQHLREYEAFQAQEIAVIGVQPYHDKTQKIKEEIERNEHFKVVGKMINPILPVRIAYAKEQELINLESDEA
ncbi:MAG: methylmalonyl-CoA mutase family protein [Flavobacteriaceae bacterium]